MSFENASVLWGHIVVDELARSGVKHVFVTPGSRSTPLVLAAARHPDIVDHSVIDERSAAFAALGVGLVTGRAAALICTSGTAVANYYPAVAEADLAGVPLILVTADRPLNLSDAGASQAMDQVEMFGGKVRWFADLGLPEADPELLAHARSRTARAAWVAGEQTGPVHLNVRFRKPLEPTSVSASHRDSVPADLNTHITVMGRPNGAPWSSWANVETVADVPPKLVQLLNSSMRPLIVVGAPQTPRDREIGGQISALAAKLGAPVLAETLSGIRLGTGSAQVIDGDLITADESFVASHPVDLVIQVGRWPINWPLQKWLRQVDCPIAAVSPFPADPEHRATFVVTGRVSRALERMIDSCSREPSTHHEDWTSRAVELRAAFDKLVDATPTLDGHVARAVAGWNEPVFVSSSMPLRDMETFVGPASQSLAVWANRGLNGIDGVVSTAAGASVALGSRVQVVIGDVAFVHDIGGLVTANRIGAELQVNVVDNGGGRIFDYLPVAKHDAPLLEKHFTTSPGLDLVAVATSLGHTSRRLKVGEAGSARGLADVVVFDNQDSDPTRTRDLVNEAIAGENLGARGPNVQSKAPDVVLLHGFTGDATTWHQVEELLNGAGISTLAIDLLGHGGRPSNRRPTIDAIVDDVLQQLDSAGATQAHVVGYSMGGRVAMALAAREPARVRSLVTIGAHPGLEDADERSARRDHDWELADRLQMGGLRPFLEFWMDLPIFATQDTLGSGWRARSLEQRERGSARSYAETLRWAGTGTQAPLWEALGGMALPHLAVAGQLDPKYTAVAHELAERTGAESTIIDGVGHAAHYESPDSVVRAILTFYDRIRQSDREVS